MALSFHINFDGSCEEAFEYYARHLGGRLGTLLRVRDAPFVPDPSVPAHGVVHANIRIAGVELAGADVGTQHYRQPQGFCVLLGLDSEDQVRSAFEALSDGGQVILAPQATFWSRCYAIVTDRFGVPWKLNCGD
ncbi:VOC family protein [Pseudoxanthomonas sp.]|uniref:VOC family protein n=1 Tax=Pseudoxanthomonas sp. TaxID=1871049 RepID=UPI00258E547B|nr:VOC family protein [Pseudoxanthomonas sp.]MCR6684878.1 VOC family protein [Pseudoxanthomonas sp.]